MAKDAQKATQAEADVAKALLSGENPNGPPAEAEEPKVGKVEARLAALEAYVKHNVKTLGWPELKG